MLIDGASQYRLALDVCQPLTLAYSTLLLNCSRNLCSCMSQLACMTASATSIPSQHNASAGSTLSVSDAQVDMGAHAGLYFHHGIGPICSIDVVTMLWLCTWLHMKTCQPQNALCRLHGMPTTEWTWCVCVAGCEVDGVLAQREVHDHLQQPGMPGLLPRYSGE